MSLPDSEIVVQPDSVFGATAYRNRLYFKIIKSVLKIALDRVSCLIR